MRILADTQILIWVATRPDILPAATLSLLADELNDIWFSVASLWEVEIKRARNKPDFNLESGQLRNSLFDAGFEELPITSAHVFALRSLQKLHKDPFDHMLIAQALAENMILLTADRIISTYDIPVHFVDAKSGH